VASQSGNFANSGFFDVSRSVFWQAHPTTVRMLLGLASLGWALCIICNPAVVDLPQYRLMMQVMPSWLWSTLFAAHFVGVFWRIFDHTPRIRWALAINFIGCYLWFTLTICINLAAGYFIPGSCLEAVTCAFAAWALVRTGLGKDVGTP
jgi:hypothetical protein